MSECSVIIEKMDAIIELLSKRNVNNIAKYKHKYQCDGVKWSGRGAWPLAYRKAISKDIGNQNFDSISKIERKKALEKYLLI